MAGLVSSLQNSSGALRVHSKGLEIVGKNLANINNRDYAKQRIAINDRGSVDTGVAVESLGIEVVQIKQSRDNFLDKTVMRENSAIERLSAEKNVLEAAQVALGQFLDRTKDSASINAAQGSSGGGISDSLVDFFNTWESLSAKPSDVGVKEQLIQNSSILAEKINLTLDRLKQVQADVESQVRIEYEEYTTILSEIQGLNIEIAKAEIGRPLAAVDLRDKRQAKLQELSKLSDANFSTVLDSNGQISVTSKGSDNNILNLLSAEELSLFPDKSELTIDFGNNDAGSIFTTNSFLEKGSLTPIEAFAFPEYISNDPLNSENLNVTKERLSTLASGIHNVIHNTTSSSSFYSIDTGEYIIPEEGITEDQLKSTIQSWTGLSGFPLSYSDINVSKNADGKFKVDINLGSSNNNSSELHKFNFSYIDAEDLNGVKTSYQIYTRSSGLQMDAALSGRVSAAQNQVQDAINSVKNIATQLKESVNDVYGSSFFTISEQPDFKILFNKSEVNAGNLKTAGQDQPSGSNQMALDIAALSKINFSTSNADKINGTFVGSFNATVTSLANYLSSVDTSLEDRKLSLQMAESARDNYSGVSQDEEITDMMKFQRAFQASARHINIIDTLLEQVVNRLGVG